MGYIFYYIDQLRTTHPAHILDLYCVQLSNAAPFCKNYIKLCFDAKHLEKGLNRGEIFGALFSEKVPFLANIECFPKFLEYALPSFPMGLVKTKSDCIVR